MGAAKHAAAAFGAGLLFGVGLVLAGMTDPAKVRGFLDLAGPWDPSLAFVMAGAIPVAAIGFALARRRERSLLGAPVAHLPARGVDARTLAGSAAFGVGWGLGGFCPGPAIVSLGTGSARAVTFVAAMVAGAAIYEALRRREARGDEADCATMASMVPPPPAR